MIFEQAQDVHGDGSEALGEARATSCWPRANAHLGRRRVILGKILPLNFAGRGAAGAAFQLCHHRGWSLPQRKRGCEYGYLVPWHTTFLLLGDHP